MGRPAGGLEGLGIPRPLSQAVASREGSVTILPLDPVAKASPQALAGFLSECRESAARAGRPKLVSITIQVESLDPLAVLESIFEPGERHFYAERPSEGWAIAGAESVLSFSATRSEERRVGKECRSR